MIGKKSVGKTSLLFLLLLGFGVFIATYNLVTMVLHNQRRESRLGVPGGDPVTGMPTDRRRLGRQTRPFHVAVTATSAAYSKWQCRVMYYWYKKMKDVEGSEMGGFTRVLHSGEPDNLMDEIPTFVVDPLPAGADRGYIVLNRPWAFVQWLEKATIPEEYILMAEPDHVFIKPLPNLASDNHPAGFHFFYIKPTEHAQIVRKFFPEKKGPLTNIDPTGNSPVIIKKVYIYYLFNKILQHVFTFNNATYAFFECNTVGRFSKLVSLAHTLSTQCSRYYMANACFSFVSLKSELEKIAPTWMNVSLSMKEDPETDKAFGWVLEMYAYAIASALHGVQHILRRDFMIQPPWDLKLGNAHIIHFTYGCDYSLKGELTYGKIGEWRFDKRTYLRGPPPRNLSLPPPGVPESVVTLVKMVNEASANIPGWDDGR